MRLARLHSRFRDRVLCTNQSIQECRVLSEQAATALTENAACCPSVPEVFTGMCTNQKPFSGIISADSDAIYAVFLFSVLVYPLDISVTHMNYCSQSTTENTHVGGAGGLNYFGFGLYANAQEPTAKLLWVWFIRNAQGPTALRLEAFE